MQENNQKDTVGKEPTPDTDTSAVSPSEEVVAEAVTEVATDTPDTAEVAAEAAAPVAETVVEEVASTPREGKTSNKAIRTYALAGLVIVVMGLGLLFVLEQQGRVSTGVFATLLDKQGAAVAEVNDVKILQSDFESGLQQLLQEASAKGVDTTDAAVLAEYEKKALDTLVNGELLRQAALEAGLTATAEVIEARFSEIKEGVGGAEALAAKMAEFGITEKTLRRDIENEILIQQLLQTVLSEAEEETLSEADIETYYEGLGGEAAGIPPLAEIKDQLAQRISEERIVTKYIDDLREKATIELSK
jgi:SurA N-terminal domain